MATITSVDRTAAGYMCCLVDCVVELWKRVYDYTCALFAYLFGETKQEAVHLPAGVVTLIGDYACGIDPLNYASFLYFRRFEKTRIIKDTFHEMHFNFQALVQPFLVQKEVIASFGAGNIGEVLIDKIAVIFKSTYVMKSRPEKRYDKFSINIREFYRVLDGQDNGLNAWGMTPDNPSFLAVVSNKWTMTEEEVTRMSSFLKEVREIPKIGAALQIPYRELPKVDISSIAPEEIEQYL